MTDISNATLRNALLNISRKDVDWFQVCRHLSYKDPILFNAIISKLDNPLSEEDPFNREIIDMLKDHGYVYTVKMVRARKGLLLKAAKDYVDALKDAVDSALGSPVKGVEVSY